ncbi:unnamed protein product [Thelazia callipaeda]|uniref:Glutamate receptor n=1 Tax=Thelazia callipaeda TaxID=103827 RepID=A0A0N5CPZ2_THECL|nr:unnamed protein product [Thelazia callipaeda]
MMTTLQHNNYILQIRKIAQNYTLNPINCVLPRGMFYPSDVLNCLCNILIKNRVSLIVYVTAQETYDQMTSASQYFLHMASQTGIPIIAWNADNAGYSQNWDLTQYRILQMAPPIEHQIKAMIAILKRYNWPNFGIVRSKIAGSLDFLQLCMTNSRLCRFRIVHEEEIDDKDDLRRIKEQLMTLKKSEAKIILLYSTSSAARKIFQAAFEVDMIGERYLWIGTQSVKGTTTSLTPPMQPGMLTINFHTVSNAMLPPTDDVLPLVIGIAPKLFGIALSKLGANESHTLQPNLSCENRPQQAKWPEGEIIYKKMKESYVKGNPYHAKDGYDSFVYRFNEYGKLNDTYLTISNLRKKSNTLVWDKVGEFTGNELRMADIEWPGGKANPPEGTADNFHITIVTLHEPPFIIVSDLDADTGTCPGNRGSICDWGTEQFVKNAVYTNRTVNKCCSGYCIDLLEKLARDIGFTYTLYKVRDEKWGIKNEKAWNGLIQDLVTNKADMCVTSLKLNSERARDIDFSIPFLETGITIIVKVKSGVLSPTAFLEPFEYSTWVLILLVSIQGAAFSIFIFERLSPSNCNKEHHPSTSHEFSLCRAYWLVWATLFGASVSTDNPRSMVSRFMALVWAAFGLTFVAVYTANLAAFMITRVQFYDLKGIDDDRLVYAEHQTPPFLYGTVEGGNTHETMKRNWFRVNQYVTNNKLFRDNISAGIEAVKKEELHAFVYDAVVLDYHAGKDPNCELITVGKWSSMTGYGFGFPKNSPYLHKVNHYMLQYHQNGDLERLQNFWMTGACTPDSNSQTRSAPLGVGNFMSAFCLLIVIGIFSLGFEYLFVYQLKKRVRYFDQSGWRGLLSTVFLF